jgi:YkoY family integral membrane protein
VGIGQWRALDPRFLPIVAEYASGLMFGQTFAVSDLAVVGVLILLEGLLSADNALVLAIMVKHLPREQQRKALTYGLVGAFVFRGVAILLAGWIIKLWWLQAIGAAYLLFLPIKHFLHKAGDGSAKDLAAKGFWATVVAVEITDIAFAVDSVLAGVAMVRSQDKLWVVYLGAIIGIVLLRFAASAFIRLLERYPDLDAVAYLLVGWVGVKLGFEAIHNLSVTAQLGWPISPLPKPVFWTVMAIIAGLGTAYAVRKGPSTTDDAETLEQEEAAERVEDVFEDVEESIEEKIFEEKNDSKS